MIIPVQICSTQNHIKRRYSLYKRTIAHWVVFQMSDVNMLNVHVCVCVCVFILSNSINVSVGACVMFVCTCRSDFSAPNPRMISRRVVWIASFDDRGADG